MTGTVMGLIEIACVGYIEMTHEVLKVCLGSPDDDMEMIGHKDKSVQRDLIDLKRTAENVQESLSVGIGEKDVLPSVAAAGHMVAGILILDTQGTGHNEIISGEDSNVNDKDLTPSLPL
jgi:hypothetical protein